MEVVGTATGGVAGLVTGDPAVGFLAGTAGTFLGGMLGDMMARHISTVESRRLNTVAGEAARLIKQYRAEGRTLRDDGFFESDVNGRTRADEVVEAAFVAAMRSHEEKKIPYIAHLLAEAAFAPNVDPATINWALARAQSLTWTQFVLLAAVGSDEYALPEGDIGAGGSWETWGAHRQLMDIGYGYGELIGARKTGTYMSGPDLAMPKQKLKDSGRLLYELLGLEMVHPDEVTAVLRALQQPASTPEKATGE